jgi:hypothetical protein
LIFIERSPCPCLDVTRRRTCVNLQQSIITRKVGINAAMLFHHILIKHLFAPEKAARRPQ